MKLYLLSQLTACIKAQIKASNHPKFIVIFGENDMLLLLDTSVCLKMAKTARQMRLPVDSPGPRFL